MRVLSQLFVGVLGIFFVMGWFASMYWAFELIAKSEILLVMMMLAIVWATCRITQNEPKC